MNCDQCHKETSEFFHCDIVVGEKHPAQYYSANKTQSITYDNFRPYIVRICIECLQNSALLKVHHRINSHFRGIGIGVGIAALWSVLVLLVNANGDPFETSTNLICYSVPGLIVIFNLIALFFDSRAQKSMMAMTLSDFKNRDEKAKQKFLNGYIQHIVKKEIRGKRSYLDKNFSQYEHNEVHWWYPQEFRKVFPKIWLTVPVSYISDATSAELTTLSPLSKNDVQTAKNPFIFRNGQKADSPEELLRLCEQFPDDGMYHLMGGHFEPWLNYIEEKEMAAFTADLRKKVPDPVECLRQFLKKEHLEPAIQTARVRKEFVGTTGEPQQPRAEITPMDRMPDEDSVLSASVEDVSDILIKGYWTMVLEDWRNQARYIGSILNRKGGFDLMRQVGNAVQLKDRKVASLLDSAWDGIGEWMG